MNFIDFMAILPVFLTLVLEGLEDMRVIRILNLKLINISPLKINFFSSGYWQGGESDPTGAGDENYESLQGFCSEANKT